jgi:hypothetical protein
MKRTSMPQTQTRINLKDRKKLLNLYLLKRTKTLAFYKKKDLKDLKAIKGLQGLKGLKDLVDQ